MKSTLIPRRLSLVMLIATVLLLSVSFQRLGPAYPLAPSGIEASPVSNTAAVAESNPRLVAVAKAEDGSFRYLVNGEPQVFIGVGYNPIYRDLSDAERVANYDRDFAILCQAGANHITGWDADKGYEQDKFDELTLDAAERHGIGIVMPIYLPPDGDYEDALFVQNLRDLAAAKVLRYKNHPALRLWGVGNEVLSDMQDEIQDSDQLDEKIKAFSGFYLGLVDMIHELDPYHPIVYREAEDSFISAVSQELRTEYDDRPWLLYGINVYTMNIGPILEDWPSYEDRPLIVSEFGSEPLTNDAGEDEGRAPGYVAMWDIIRQHPDYVLGGSAYAWTTAGPEPSDIKWGLTDGDSQPVDDTFDSLAERWRAEQANHACQ